MQTPIFPNTLDLEMLVKELDQTFPDTMPDPNTSMQEFYVRAGQVSVVRYLKDKFTEE